jgi:hypothetical protein
MNGAAERKNLPEKPAVNSGPKPLRGKPAEAG